MPKWSNEPVESLALGGLGGYTQANPYSVPFGAPGDGLNERTVVEIIESLTPEQRQEFLRAIAPQRPIDTIPDPRFTQEMVPADPTLRDRLQSYLHSTFGSSPEGRRKASTWMDVADVVDPGFMLAGEAGRDLREGNYASGAFGGGLAALGVVPVAGPALRKAAKPLKRVFHGTSPASAERIAEEGFDIGQTADGSIWFTSKRDIGDVGATGKGAIIERRIDESKLNLAGFEETDKYMTDQLEQMGYDGAKWDMGEGVDHYSIWNTDKLYSPFGGRALYEDSQLPSRQIKRRSTDDPARVLRAEIREKRADRRNNPPSLRFPGTEISQRLERFRDTNKLNSRLDDVDNARNSRYWSRSEMEKIKEGYRIDHIPGAEFAKRSANLKGLVRGLRKEDWSVTHTSTNNGLVSSYYLTKNGKTIRVSDHDLPESPQRLHNRSMGFGGQWDDDILVDNFSDIETLLREINENY